MVSIRFKGRIIPTNCKYSVSPPFETGINFPFECPPGVAPRGSCRASFNHGKVVIDLSLPLFDINIHMPFAYRSAYYCPHAL